MLQPDVHLPENETVCVAFYATCGSISNLYAVPDPSLQLSDAFPRIFLLAVFAEDSVMTPVASVYPRHFYTASKTLHIKHPGIIRKYSEWDALSDV